MKRLFVAMLCLGALAACKKEAPPPAAENTQAEANAEPEGDVAPPARGDDDDAPKPPEGEEKLVVNEDILTRFLTYWDKSLDAAHEAMNDLGKAAQEADQKGGAMGAAHAMQASNSISERMETKRAALLKEYNLTEYQARELQDLCGGMGAQLAIVKQGGLEAMVANMKKQLAALPPDQQAASKKQVEELEKTVNEQKNFSDLRQRFGDDAVNIALKHQDEIVRVQQKAFGVLK